MTKVKMLDQHPEAGAKWELPSRFCQTAPTWSRWGGEDFGLAMKKIGFILQQLQSCPKEVPD